MIPFTSSMLWTRSGRTDGSLQNVIIIGPNIATLQTATTATGAVGNDPRRLRPAFTIVIPGPSMENKSAPPASTVAAATTATISLAPLATLNSGDRLLLDSLDCRSNRPLHAGPFLTVQRRRRRRKYVRTYLFKDPTLIDDLSSYQTNFVLERINNWQFNAFILDNVTGGRPLPNLCVHLFKSYGLFDHFKLDPVIIWKLFSIIEDGYHWRNPYHNAVHAADVTQAMHCFLQEKFILEKLTPLEIFSAIVAAVTHDLDHPGVNQPFLVATSNHLASLYKNSSVLENHHWRSAMGCLNESGVSDILGPEVVAQVETQIKELVLATDITRQPDFLKQLRDHLENNTLDMSSPDVRQFVLQIALKCADISNPCRPWEISRKWSIKVCEEFFRQGDYERQLSLPVTPSFDRYTSSVPKIQIGFFNFIVEPLFVEWNRMMNTPLAQDMMDNLQTNKSNWERLKVEETAPRPPGDASQREIIEIPQHLIVDEDTISLNADIIAARKAFDGETAQQVATTAAEGSGGELHRSVRFDTTITTASDSENSEGDEASTVSNALDRDFLVPRPDGRRHSIATGLMGSNIQIPAQLLSLKSPTHQHHGGSSHNLTGGDVSPSARMVGRTMIRRESLPGTLGPGGKTLSTKTILHLQKISSAKQRADAAGAGSDTDSESLSPMTGDGGGEFSSHIVSSAPIPVSPARLVERSSCSSSTTDEILDFTYSLPETVMSGGGRSSGSPSRRLLHETTDFDELCPGTSILSMSPSVTQLQLQHGIAADLEEQRRHLIRQQTCPVVSLNADGSFNRPRFLSAAAAISPTTAATSTIISQRMKNKSPESGERGGSGDLPGRVSGASSSEALLCCEVISEEGDRQSSSSGSSRCGSHEASPLEIFVQQFPPGSDDNDGEAPRRESGDTSSELLSSSLTNISTYPRSTASSATRNPSSYSSPDSSSATKLSLDEPSSASASSHSHKQICKSQSTQSSGCNEPGHCDPEECASSSERSSKHHQQQEIDRRQEMKLKEESDRSNNTQQDHIINPASSNKKPLITSMTVSTQTYDNDAQEQQNPSTSASSVQAATTKTKKEQQPDLNKTSSSSMSPSSTSSRIATILMWRNNRLWRSLTEEADENNFVLSSLDLQRRMYEKQLLPEYCTERWDLRFSQQLHQGVVGGRLQIRRGSAPTTTPAMGCRGAQDRRSDPTQYHSSSCLTTCQNNLNNLGLPFHTHDTLLCSCNYPQLGGNKNQVRRGSIPVELLKQTNLRPGPSTKKPPNLTKTVRRGSLPCESAASNLESTYAHKWLHVFPYNDEDEKNAASLKRRSSGGPEIFAAAQRKISSSATCASGLGHEGWRTQILIEQFDVPETASSSSTATGTTAYWQGPRRGSLPVDVYRSSGGSCSSESESSGDASDT